MSSKRLFAEVDFGGVAAVNSVILPCNDSWTNENSDPRPRIFRAQGLQTRLECFSHFTTSNPALWRFWGNISPLQSFLLDGLKRFSVEILLLPNLTLKLQLHSLHCSFGFIGNSPFPQRDASETFWHFVLVLHVSWKVHFRSEDQAFYWSIYDSCWQDQMSVRALRHDKQGRRFSNFRGLPASVSFLSSPPPPRLLGPFFARSLLRGLWLSKQHGNACYAGYKELHTFVIAEQSDWSRKISLAMTRQITQEDINLLLTKTTAARSSQEAVMTSHCS